MSAIFNLFRNVFWWLTVGIITALEFFFFGLFLCITLIGIPYGLDCFKLAGFTLNPFGKEIDTDFSSHPIANLIWLFYGGITLALTYAILGLILCVTIIGIPFGKQCFKLAKASLSPFGADIY
jgi:uncharacterized membrane protein YccF (DUF307 family)